MLRSSDFLVQARMAQTVDINGDLLQATQFQAFAMKSEVSGAVSDRIHIELNNNRTGT